MSLQELSEEQIFEAALRLDSEAARRAYLDQVCGDNEGLRRSVEALICSHERAADLNFLSADARPRETISLAIAQEAEGALLGRYRLLQKLGEGGCGEVYMAEQEEPVRRQVALKVIKTGMDTRAVIARFEAERQALALMDHPGIARIYDAGATDSGRPFFVMELVRGARITDYCHEQRLGLESRLELFIKVCEAIQHAHQKGIIHRDIKPSNILVTVHDHVAVPKVIDFGIAKAIETPLTDKTLLTQFQLLGTPGYMSPEQVEMTGESLDTRSDIYSLGIVLYELITGTTPFDSRALLGAGLEELRRTIREVEPPRPSTRLMAIRKFESGSSDDVERGVQMDELEVRGDLDWIVMTCLEKDPTRRYPTASALADDIRRHLANEPVIARPPNRAYLVGKFVRRNRGAVAALSAIACILVIASVVSSGLAVRATRAERRERELRRRAEQATEEARIQAYTSDMRSAASAVSASHFGQAAGLLKRHLPRPGEVDLRGIEWRYLWEAARGDETRSIAYDQFVKCVRMSPDGRLLATSSFGPEIRVVDLSSGLTLTNLQARAEQNVLENIAFSPDGTLFAAGTLEGIRVWKTEEWQLDHQWDGACDALQFSSDGTSLACMGRDGVRLFDTAKGELKGTLTSQQKGHGHLAFAPQSNLLAVVYRNASPVELWNLDSQEKIAELEGRGSMITVAFAPEGQWLAAGNSEGELYLWDLATQTLVSAQKIHQGWVFGLAFSPDGKVLATVGGDQVIQLWDMSVVGSSGVSRVATLKGHRNEIWSVAFSSDGRRLATGGKDAAVKIWDLPPRRATSTTLKVPEQSISLGFMSDARQYLVLSPNFDELQVWDIDRSELLQRTPVQPHGAVLFNASRVTFGTATGFVESWMVPGTAPTRRVALSEGRIMALQASFDGDWVVAWDPARERATLWNLGTGERVLELTDFSVVEAASSWSKSQRIAFSPDSHWMAYAAKNYSIQLYDLRRHEMGVNARGHLWHIQCLRFSPDSSRLASGSWDAHARLWDPSTGLETVPALSGHLTGIGSLSFSPDGRTLVTRGGDDSLTFWSTYNGSGMLTLSGARVWFFDMLSRDGNAMAWEETGASGRLRVQYFPTLESIDAVERERSR